MKGSRAGKFRAGGDEEDFNGFKGELRRMGRENLMNLRNRTVYRENYYFDRLLMIGIEMKKRGIAPTESVGTLS